MRLTQDQMDEIAETGSTMIGDVPQGSTFLDRLQAERRELHGRIEKLTAMQGTDRFASLTPEHRELLKDQYDTMLAYRSILLRRIRLLGQE